MWARCSQALLGCLLLWSPQALHYGGAFAQSDRAVGALVVSLSLLSTNAVTQAARHLIVPAAVWLMLSSPLLGEPYDMHIAGARVAVGAALVWLSKARCTSQARRGGGWGAVLHPLRVLPGRTRA